MAKKAVTASGNDLWLAQGDLEDCELMAPGHTPEEAMDALLAAWKNACEKWRRGDPASAKEYREDLKVLRITPGNGYVIGVTDGLWVPEILTGDDGRFDAVFEKHGLAESDVNAFR